MSYLFRCFTQRSGSICVALICTLFNVSCQALELLIRDQSGRPVESAIVTVTGGAGISPKSQLRVMDQVHQAFLPHVLLVNAGDMVEFPNSDNIRHHVYSFSEPKVFEIKLYANRPEKPLPFTTPGIVVLGCNIHDNMLGYIYVSPTPYAAMSDAEGRVRLAMPENYEGITVWHEYYALSETEVMTLSTDQMQTLPEREGAVEITIELLPQEPVKQESPENGFGNSMRR